MDIHDIFALASRLGVTLRHEGDAIIANPRANITPELVDAIHANKKALLVELRMVERMSRASWTHGDAQTWLSKRKGG